MWKKYFLLFLAIVSLLSPTLTSSSKHGPISINSDQELLDTASREGWPGDGSPDNPIIIRGLEIDAEGGPFALYLGNTTLHVVVEDCTLLGASSEYYYWGAGLILHNVSNFSIKNSEIRDSHKGVIVHFSSGVNIRGLRIGAERKGILLDRSDEISLNNIEVFSRVDYGLYAEEVDGLTLEGISINSGLYGVYVLDSSNVNITADISSLEHHGIRIANSVDVWVTNTVANGCSIGISIYNSRHIHILDSNFSNNTYFGVKISYSENVTVEDNNCNNNGNNGIYLYNSKFNFIKNNICNYNRRYHGISLDRGSNGNLIRGNVAVGNNYFGIWVGEADDNVIVGNRLEDNGFGAVSIFRSSGTVLWSNTMVHGGVSLFSDVASDLVSQEIPENNTVNGKPIRYIKSSYGGTVAAGAGQVIVALSQSVVVEDQEIDNATFGILVIGSSYVTLRNNELSGSLMNGIYLVGATYATLRDNSLNGCGVTVVGNAETHFDSHDIDDSNMVNGAPLIYISGASDATISGAGEVIIASSNHIHVTGGLGPSNIPLTIAYSENVSFSGEISRSGSYGILIFESSRVEIQATVSSGNVYVESSDNITIENGEFSNFDFGVVISNSDNVSISGIRVTDMDYGIYVRDSKNVTIVHSSISSCRVGLDAMRSEIILENNTISNCESYAFRFSKVSGTVRNNNFLFNNGAGEEYDPDHAQAYCWQSSVDIRWNFWSDWTGPDEDGDGFVDEPYVLAGGCEDPAPRAEPVVPEFPF